MRKTSLNSKKGSRESLRARSPAIQGGAFGSEGNPDFEYDTRGFSYFARAAASLLFFIFLLQPLSVVFADESAAAASDALSAPPPMAVTETTMVASPQEVADGPSRSNQAVQVASDTIATSTATQQAIDVPSAESLEATSTTRDSATSSSEVVSSNGSSTESGTSTIEGMSDTSTTVAEDSKQSAPVAVPSAEKTVASSTASTTEEATVAQPEVTTQINDQNRYQFGVNDCVTVENGFFYCSKNAVPKMTSEDKVYAAQDADGDYEIFISKNGVDTQITHNTYDDRAPFYDAQSNRLVWHALINDRYQIMLYDFATQKMEQFTHEPYNSMQPMVLGNRIVWQAWIDNNWEIVLDENGVRTQLTHNTTHDIAPHLRGDLVSWQSQTSNTRDITVYNLKTKETNVITGAGGADASNPRFLLVYDSLQANGDTATVGYDPETGKVVPLSAIPSSAPKDIPEPDHAKDKVAFVQSAPTVKNENDADVEDATTSVAVGTESTSTPDVIASPGDIVVPTATTSASVIQEPTTTVPSIDMTTVIPVPAATSSQVSIPDLIIPAFVSSSNEGQ